MPNQDSGVPSDTPWMFHDVPARNIKELTEEVITFMKTMVPVINDIGFGWVVRGITISILITLGIIIYVLSSTWITLVITVGTIAHAITRYLSNKFKVVELLLIPPTFIVSGASSAIWMAEHGLGCAWFFSVLLAITSVAMFAYALVMRS